MDKSIITIAAVENRDIEKELDKQTIQTKRFIYVDENPAKGIEQRRKRIAFNHNTFLRPAVNSFDGEWVFQVEGDAVLPENALERLISDIEFLNDPYLGYVSGAQVGRHGIYHIGAWNFERRDTASPFRSIDYRSRGLHQVDATGFYCLLAKKEAWLAAKPRWTDEPYGPDVVWGLNMCDKGYNIFIDMDLHIGHKVGKHVINVTDETTQNVRFYFDGTWRYKIEL